MVNDLGKKLTAGLGKCKGVLIAKYAKGNGANYDMRIADWSAGLQSAEGGFFAKRQASSTPVRRA